VKRRIVLRNRPWSTRLAALASTGVQEGSSMRPIAWATTLVALLSLAQAGCAHIGPGTIVADRIPYNNAVAASWKEQTLLNIVKLRYLDTPFFIDVPQITSGYALQGTATAIGSIVPPVNPAASFAQQLAATLNYQESYLDRPTISYTPQTGALFIRNLTTPLAPSSIFRLLQAGYPADVVLNLAVDSINGVRNHSVAGGQVRPADPEFARFVQVMRRAQASGEAGIRIEVEKDRTESVVFFFRGQNIDPELASQLDQVRRDLRLDPKASEFKVTFGGVARSANEISILTRSIIRILSELSTSVEVPPEHLAEGIAPDIGEQEVDAVPYFQVRSGDKKPCDAFAAVCYEGHWFWIDKRDTQSKRTVAYLLVLLALADTGPKENLPVVTIPAG
jgi:hypothetical protein